MGVMASRRVPANSPPFTLHCHSAQSHYTVILNEVKNLNSLPQAVIRPGKLVVGKDLRPFGKLRATLLLLYFCIDT